jgi:hypothetical protein
VTGPIVLALSVSFIAGLCAYVITLEEAQHHFPSRRRQQMEALRTGFVAMLFFILLAVALAFVFSRMFGADSGPSSTGNHAAGSRPPVQLPRAAPRTAARLTSGRRPAQRGRVVGHHR